jgi:hypothetical protein
MARRGAVRHVALWAERNIVPEEQERFREDADREVLGLNLNEGNFARYAVTPSDFSAWYAAWTASGPTS